MISENDKIKIEKLKTNVKTIDDLQNLMYDFDDKYRNALNMKNVLLNQNETYKPFILFSYEMNGKKSHVEIDDIFKNKLVDFLDTLSDVYVNKRNFYKKSITDHLKKIEKDK